MCSTALLFPWYSLLGMGISHFTKKTNGFTRGMVLGLDMALGKGHFLDRAGPSHQTSERAF
ncbi:hypothetical protein QQP08_018960 [Theobroma cacao]|nr:hypothetical protein QQP08_018960 [Theobroma cacao]